MLIFIGESKSFKLKEGELSSKVSQCHMHPVKCAKVILFCVVQRIYVCGIPVSKNFYSDIGI